ncbi:MAG TPA: hypothetical protein VJT49_17875 [Amycolatopsis sp.]|uniref:hypothetical protein n=1 Tax=Amycolatopsis sp. TaxID=37632 RepID=UPI002B46B716|nr:hypothetical protein [Amycolatopsis sp.]HKS46938.1 hypothetical protein [Amycolatopsis sp.]
MARFHRHDLVHEYDVTLCRTEPDNEVGAALRRRETILSTENMIDACRGRSDHEGTREGRMP